MSAGVNVLRYSALVFGIFYGFSRQASISSTQATEKEKHEFQHKQHLIHKAKEEFKNKKKSSSIFGSLGGDVITDPDNPKFDLEKYLNMVAEQK